jgi:hypothetical protein
MSSDGRQLGLVALRTELLWSYLPFFGRPAVT